MSIFDNLAKKATDFVNSEQGQKTLKSEKAEGLTDKILDAAAAAADKATGGKHIDKITDARDSADKRIGNA